jgi:hypothetical protein
LVEPFVQDDVMLDERVLVMLELLLDKPHPSVENLNFLDQVKHSSKVSHKRF